MMVDLDVYINKTGANQLWENDYIGSATESAALYQNSYVRVVPKIDLGSGVYREATNSIVFLQDCNGKYDLWDKRGWRGRWPWNAKDSLVALRITIWT